MAETPSQGGTGGDQPEVIWAAGEEKTLAPAAAPPRKRFRWWIPAVLIIAAGAAIGAVYYARLAKPVEMVKAVAPDVDLWVEFDLQRTPSRLQKIQPFLEAMKKADLETRAISVLERNTGVAGFKVNWKQDVEPWVGAKFGFSISGIFDAAMGGPANSKPPTLLGVMAIRNGKQADAFLSRLGEHLRKQDNWKVSTQSQHGQVIHVYRPSYSFSEGEDFCYAVSGSLLIVSNRPSELANAIARLKGDRESLATAEWYQKTIAKAPADALARGVFSTEKMKNLYRSMGAALPSKDRQDLQRAMEGAATTAAMWSDITPQGITTGSFTFPSKVESGEARKALAAATKEDAWVSSFTTAPKDSLASLGILGVADYYRIFAPTLAAGPYSYAIKMFEAQTGLNLEKDVFGWMHGLTVTLISVGQGPVGVELVAEIRGQSPETAREKVQKLIATVCRLGGLVTKPVNIGAAPATVLTFSERPELALRRGVSTKEIPVTALMLSGRPILYYAFADKSVLVASDAKSLESGLRARKDPAARITAGPTWEKAAGARKEPAWFAVFADMPQIAQAVKHAIPAAGMSEGGEQAVAILNSIPWIAMSATALEDGYGSSASIGMDYNAFCQNLAALLEKTEKEMPKGRGR
jgi:hypothetical protein